MLPTVNLRELEALAMKEALDLTRGDKKAAAKLLGVSRSAFYAKLHRHGFLGKPEQTTAGPPAPPPSGA